MDQHSQEFESLFRKLSEKLFETPSAGVLRKLRFRLRASDFFSFNLRKVNFIYSVVFVGGVLSGIFLLQKPGIKTDSSLVETSLTDKGEILASEKEINNAILKPANIDEQGFEETSDAILTAMFEVEKLNGCAPIHIRFTDKSVNADSWHWDFGSGDYSEKQNPGYTYNKPGHYKVTLSVKNVKGTEDTYFREIDILQSPVAAMDIDRDNSDITARKIVFKNESEGASQYSWDFGDAEQSDAQHVSHLYENYGVYNVKLIAKAANGCSDTASLVNKFIERNYELSFPQYFRPNPYDRSNNGYYESAGNEAFIFYPKNFGVKEYNLTIYTLNGIQVFRTDNIKQGWNGYIGGNLAPGGYYSFTAKGIYPNGKEFEIQGKVKVLIENYY